MYLPPFFHEQHLSVLHTFMDEHGFATLISVGDPPVVTHLPLIIDNSQSSRGTVLGHLAKANPHAALLNGTRATAIFHGPHAYVTPSWYDSLHPAVPTWNYAVVHATGIPIVHTDTEWIKELLIRTIAKYETPRARPWKYDIPLEFLNAKLSHIVAFEMPIETLEGKFKLSQNRSEKDRVSVADALDREGSSGIAALMRKSFKQRSESQNDELV